MLSLLTLFCGTMMAEEVTIDFNNDVATLFPTITSYSSGSGASYVADGEFQETTTSVAVGGVTVTVTASPADANNRNRLWASNPRLRMYDGTITFTSAGEKITKMVITRSTNSGKIANQNTVDSGELTTSDQQSNGVVTWTGEAQSVTMTIAGNTQFSKVVLTLGEDGGGGETPPTPQVEQVTVAEALAIIDALADGAKTDKEYQVKGFVVELTDINTTYYNATFTMADTKGGSPVFTYFRGKGLNGLDVTDANFLKVDDEVVVQGLLQKYVKDGNVTPEMAQGGKIISINGDTGGDVTVEKAADIAAFNTLEVGKVAELTLTNAVVTYVNAYNGTTELFVRDSKGVIDLYNLGINAEAGQVLNGTIIGTRGVNSGFVFAMKPATNTNASTVTVSGTAGDVEATDIGFDEAADNFCNYVVLKGVTIDADKKNAVNEDDETMPLYDRFKLSLLSDLKADGTKSDIYGLMYDGGDTYGAELVVTKVTLAGGGVIVDDPATPVESIAALLGMESPSSNLELTLTNAKVLFIDGNNYVYVRENGKALCFYQISGLKDVAKNNSVINGKIQVDYEVFRMLPEVKSNKNTNLDGLVIEESEEEAQPTETTLANVAAGDNVCDLVTLTATLVREVTYKEDGETVASTTYYLQDGDTKLVVVNNSKNLKTLADNAVETIIVTGIVNTASDAYQIKLTKNAVDPNESSIADLTTDRQADGAIYNLAGQRVEKAQKGLYIIGGKKVMK